MAHRFHNPFVNIDLIAPNEHRADYNEYCQTLTVGKTSVNRSPFPRAVDLWFAGLSLAARKDLEPAKLVVKKSFNFITGSIFNSDIWRVQTVMLIAIATDDNVEVVNNPSRMMAIANGLAAEGVPQIVEMLRTGNNKPIWNLSEALHDFLGSQISNEEVTDSWRITNVLS